MQVNGKRIIGAFVAQMERIRAVHDEDLESGYGGVLLEDALDKKYRNAAKTFIWQWFFPQQNLTYISATKELRRYHVGEKDVQAALIIRSGPSGENH